MKYKFNPFTGRLSSPMSLEVPSKFVKTVVESPQMQFAVGTRIAAPDQPARRGRYAPVPPVLLSKMKLFQVPNGLPVHIKGGPTDKIMFAITSAVCLAGLVECVRVWYTLSYPPTAKSE